MRVLRQKNVYFVDLSKSIYRGFVETTLRKEPGEAIAVYRIADLEILAVEILDAGSAVSAPYELRDLAETINRHEASFGRSLWSDMCAENTLQISVPEDAEEVRVRITYRPGQHNDAVCFYRPVSEEDRHREAVATNRMFDSSAVFPSLLTPHKNEWELVYIVPNSEEIKIVSPGVFRSVREEQAVTLYSYSVDMACSGHLNFGIGTFDAYEVATGDDKRAVYIPKSLERCKESVKDFCADVESLIRYAEHFLQREYPFKVLSIALLFGDADRVYGQNTAFLAISNLSADSDIEPMFVMKRLAADIVSAQIFYFYFSVVDAADFWVFEGLKGYFHDYCVRYLLGNNEALYTLKKDRDYVLENDVVEYALYDTRRTLLSMRSRFFRTKAKVFFHVLEGSLSRAFMEKIANYALKRREDVGESYSCEFIRLVKDVTGKDLKPLFEAYVFRPGAVRVRFSFSINKKTNRVDFNIAQMPTSVLLNANRAVCGPVTIRAYEMEGVFEHAFALDQESFFYYHPRTKKKKKVEEEEEIMPLLWMRVDPKGEHLAKMVLEQPDYMFIEQLLDKNVVGQMEALESLSVKPSTQVCEIFERILENAHVFYKIRVEVLYILSRTVVGTYYGFQRLIQYFIKKYCVQTSTVVKPNDFMFIPYFLQKHLVKALSLTDPFVFRSYSGREVGSASIVCAFIINILRFNDNSLNAYSDSWYIASVIEDLSFPLSVAGDADAEKTDTRSVQTRQRRDEISDLFISEETNASFSRRDFEDSSDATQLCNELDRSGEDAKTPEEHRMRMMPEYGEGSLEPDTNYLQTSIDEIERFRILDMVFPSHRNLVTKACIYALGRLSLFGKMGLRKDTLLQLSEYPNIDQVRIAATEVLVILFYEDEGVIEAVLRRMLSESFTIKSVVLRVLRTLGCSSRLGVKRALKRGRAELFDLLRASQGNLVVRELVSDLIYLVEDADMSPEEYRRAVVSKYQSTFSADVYRALGKLDRDVRKTRVAVRLGNMGALRKRLLHTEYIVRLPVPKRTRSRKLTAGWEERSVPEDAGKIRIPGCFRIQIPGLDGAARS